MSWTVPVSHRKHNTQSNRKRLAPKPFAIKESDVERTITEFLEWDGWRSIKTDPVSDRATVQAIRKVLLENAKTDGVLAGVIGKVMAIMNMCVRGKGFGETGMADKLFIRYKDPVIAYARAVECECQVMWIEFKLPGQKPRADQLEWHQQERARGALVLVVDDIDHFMKTWYPESGLQRNAPVR